MSTALAADLVDLSSSVGLNSDTVAEPLEALTRDLRIATDAYLGLQLVLFDQGYPLTLTAFAPGTEQGQIRASLRLPWALLNRSTGQRAAADDAASTLTLYASRLGTFVDLAADLTYALRTPDPPRGEPTPSSGPSTIRLDHDLTPITLLSGFVGPGEASTINRAVGFLIGQGSDADEARAELVSRAGAAGISVLLFAVSLLRPGER